jgi:hypothetical protein
MKNEAPSVLNPRRKPVPRQTRQSCNRTSQRSWTPSSQICRLPLRRQPLSNWQNRLIEFLCRSAAQMLSLLLSTMLLPTSESKQHTWNLEIQEELPADPLGTAHVESAGQFVDSSIVQVSAANFVVLKTWLAEAGFKDDDYTITCGQPAKRFAIRFCGANGLASRRATIAISSLNRDGESKRLSVQRDDGT